ncbi:MAG: hypothetical protein GF311_13460 [Candidatus Lokiarchaeota archaeon]|nr:hypothetical protein [Candidatus Lokiarchaeota archaeon]
MEIVLETSIYIFIIGFYTILLLVLLYKLAKDNFSVPYLTLIPLFGILGGIFAILHMSDILPSFLYLDTIILALELIFWGFQFFFLYLFLEYLSTPRPHNMRMLCAFGLFLLQIFSHLLIIWFELISSSKSDNIWLLADIGYNNLAFFSLIFGIYTYYKVYHDTREKRAAGFIIGLSLAFIGFIFHSLVDYIGFFSTLPEFLEEIGFLGDILPMFGLFVFIATYLYDLNYIYRLHGDHLLLLVTYKNGLAIHSIEFECGSNIKIEENFFSGFISSLSFVFDKVLKSKYPLESISSKDETIMIRSGKKILVIFLTRNPTSILMKAMDKYIQFFEERFCNELEREELEISKFRSAKDLIKPIFPFLKVRETQEIPFL